MYPLTARVPPTVAVEDVVRVVKFVDPVTPKLPPTERFPVSVSPAVVILVALMDANVPVPVQAMDANDPVPVQATAEAPTGPNAPVPVQATDAKVPVPVQATADAPTGPNVPVPPPDVILVQVTAPLPVALKG